MTADNTEAMRARSLEIARNVDRLIRAAHEVCRFDWSENDDDAVAAVDALRSIVREIDDDRREDNCPQAAQPRSPEQAVERLVCRLLTEARQAGELTDENIPHVAISVMHKLADKVERLQEALRRMQTALIDLGGHLCGRLFNEAVMESSKRIRDSGGTLAYIAHLQADIDAALAASPEPQDNDLPTAADVRGILPRSEPGGEWQWVPKIATMTMLNALSDAIADGVSDQRKYERVLAAAPRGGDNAG